MTRTVAFPGLGLEFHLNRVAFELFGLPIYWYGVITLCFIWTSSGTQGEAWIWAKCWISGTAVWPFMAALSPQR